MKRENETFHRCSFIVNINSHDPIQSQSPYRCILGTEEAATSRFFGVDYINFLLIYARITFKVFRLMHRERGTSERRRRNFRNVSMMTSDSFFLFFFFSFSSRSWAKRWWIFLDEMRQLINKCIRYEVYCILQ